MTNTPELQGKLLAGALKLTHINIVTVNEQGEAIKEERILEGLGERIRDIETSPTATFSSVLTTIYIA